MNLDLRAFKWIVAIAPLGFIALLEYARHLLLPELTAWPQRLILDGVILTGGIFFYGFVFHFIARLQGQLGHQNRELLALHRAALDIYGELSLDVVLQKVVDQARQLLDARYGAVSVINDEGAIEHFMVSGVSVETRKRIGSPPLGKGLLGVVLREGTHLRLADMRQHSEAVGFPPHHPQMTSLLAVPVLCKGPSKGNLYLADKLTAARFSEEDEETLVRFATAAAIAIDNAQLHQQMRSLAVAEERVRIAREMHDGMAQVLAYVNTKAQAVQEYLRADKADEAARQLDQLASAARDVYNDVREGILALRTQVSRHASLSDSLPGFLQTWQDQSGIPVTLEAAGQIQLTPHVELQLLRIIQESLSNVRKHSNARHASIRLVQSGDEFCAEVLDDGSGFDPLAIDRRERPRFGLAIMRERAESVGGRFELASARGEGTRVTVRIPTGAAVR